MECVAYMRVSTEKQAEEGNGLESQKRDIELYCRKNELIIADWYIDDWCISISDMKKIKAMTTQACLKKYGNF